MQIRFRKEVEHDPGEQRELEAEREEEAERSREPVLAGVED